MPIKYTKKATIHFNLIVKAKEVKLRCKKAKDMLNLYFDGKVYRKSYQLSIDKREKAKAELFEIIQQL